MSVFPREHTLDEAKMSNNGIDGFTSQQQETDTASQRSTGPRTPTGKSRSKHNAVKHGLFSQVIVLLPDESQSELDDLVKGVRRSRKPKGALEEALVDKIATLLWRYRRFLKTEGAASYLDSDENLRLRRRDLEIRYETHLDRALDRALAQLQRLQDMRKLQSGVTQRSVSGSTDELKGEVRLVLAPPKA
jgi:hypothetical protein